MRGWRALGSPVVRRALVFWLAAACVAFNGVFDLLVERGGKEYLIGQALSELGRGPKVTLHEVMRAAIRRSARTAAVWAMLLFLAGAGTTLAVWAAARRESASPPGGAAAGGREALRQPPPS
jgi:hypothetical protein